MVGSNEAEKILFALEHRRSTPLQSAKSAVPFSQGGPFPAELVGASTRQIRKAINVPLATSITARAGETARSRREKELAADRERGVSVLISPYGRRRQAEQEKREIRRSQSMTSDAGKWEENGEGVQS
jgi:nucleoporin NUP1